MGKVVEMNNNTMPFHVLHKVPTGDSLYVRAKHVQVFTISLLLLNP